MTDACKKHDEALLMSVHRDLHGREAIALALHLAVCPRCRARRRSLEAVTFSLAASLANPSLGMRTFRGPSRAPWASVGLVVALFGLFLAIVSTEIAVSATSNATYSTAPASTVTMGHAQCDVADAPAHVVKSR